MTSPFSLGGRVLQALTDDNVHVTPPTNPDHIVDTVERLDAIYAEAAGAALVKVADRVTDDYARLIAASPFAVLATVGPEGMDCSPRGDHPGFVRVADERTLLLPDRQGNNRIDSLRNIVRDPRAALLFLIPGIGTTLRVNARAQINVEPNRLASFAVEGTAPRSVIVLTVEAVYFQCARAILRSRLWEQDARADPAALPTPGAILARMSAGQHGGEEYDKSWPQRAATSLW